MFPTYARDDKNEFMQEKHRRRARNDPHNRDYICPCGKSYLSYPALFTHIKQKHNGRAPGQIIKPKPENGKTRGRPKQRENYDSESETEDEAANVIGNICDYITDIEREPPFELRRLYVGSAFYLTYAAYKELDVKYNQIEDIYQGAIDHVLCQFLSQISKRELEPNLFDQIFMFMMLLTRSLNEMNKTKQGQQQYIKREGAKKIIFGFNNFILDYLPKYMKELNLENKEFLVLKNVVKILEYLYAWLMNKKYIKDRLKRNPEMIVPGEVRVEEDEGMNRRKERGGEDMYQEEIMEEDEEEEESSKRKDF